MSEELKPCPFCGGKNIVTIRSFPQQGLECVCDYRCGGCGASGGRRPSEKEAIEAWNTRAERTCSMTFATWRKELITYWGCECSSCRKQFPFKAEDDWSYCPNCGAKVVQR